jgi:hypothetical protein
MHAHHYLITDFINLIKKQWNNEIITCDTLISLLLKLNIIKKIISTSKFKFYLRNNFKNIR